jgi:epoxyqueuosine reductase
VCPWNVKFSRDATEEAFAARDVIAAKNARTLATEVLAMSQEEFSAAFRKSPMKRAKRAGLQRNARVILERADEV